MKKTYELELEDIYGGDGFCRSIEVESSKLSRTKTRKRTRSDIGLTTQDALDESLTEKSQKEVQTFNKDESGKPMLRLGGAHGKLWGALREARGILYTLGYNEFRSRNLMDTIQVQPVWCVLSPPDGQLLETDLVELPQILNTMGRSSMITMRFDKVKHAKVSITLIFPDELDSQVGKLLAQLTNMSLFNKRRAILKSYREIKV